MNRHVIRLGLIGALLSYPTYTRGAEISSTFDAGLESWTAGDDTTLSHLSSGGNPGGYASLAPKYDIAECNAMAPPKFAGNLLAFDHGTLLFDSVVLGGGPGDPRPDFGLVQISNGTTTLSQDLAQEIPPLESWRTYSGLFSASAFGADEATWTSVLSNVTSITVSLNAYDEASGGRTFGLDNFILVPEPPAGILVLLALMPLSFYAPLRRLTLARWGG